MREVGNSLAIITSDRHDDEQSKGPKQESGRETKSKSKGKKSVPLTDNENPLDGA